MSARIILLTTVVCLLPMAAIGVLPAAGSTAATEVTTVGQVVATGDSVNGHCVFAPTTMLLVPGSEGFAHAILKIRDGCSLTVVEVCKSYSQCPDQADLRSGAGDMLGGSPIPSTCVTCPSTVRIDPAASTTDPNCVVYQQILSDYRYQQTFNTPTMTNPFHTTTIRMGGLRDAADWHYGSYCPYVGDFSNAGACQAENWDLQYHSNYMCSSDYYSNIVLPSTSAAGAWKGSFRDSYDGADYSLHTGVKGNPDGTGECESSHWGTVPNHGELRWDCNYV